MTRQSRAGRSAPTALIVAALLALVATLTPSASASDPDASRVALRGTYQQLAAVTRTGEHTLHALHTGRGTFWLDLDGRHTPPPGARLDLTGTLDGSTVSVATMQVTTVSARRAATAPRSHRMLVMRAYWTAATPKRPSTVQARNLFLARGKSWFEEVSHGRYTISGTVTRWLKIKRPSGCTYGAFTAMDQAKAAARRSGHNLGAYSRFLLYLPCDGGGMVGLGSMPGADLWQFGSLAYDVAIHEQGHNLGVRHANARECSAGVAQVTWSDSCATLPYGDTMDVMGNRGPGQFQAFHKKQLGWLQKMATLRGTGSRVLKPHGTTGLGLKALQVRVSQAKSYWVEYRTKFGVDSGFAPQGHGVVVRARTSVGDVEPQLLDLMPGSGYGLAGGRTYLEWDRVHLPVGSSWTSPERVRLTTVSQSASGAKVAVQFNAPTPGAPAAPGAVTARPGPRAATVTWSKPVDNGSIITSYVVTASPSSPLVPAQTVDSVGGLVRSATFSDLDPTKDYTFSVRARNRVGTSAATTSVPVRPLTDAPTVLLTAPAQNTEVSGPFTATATATPNPGTGSAIDWVEFQVEGPFGWESVSWDGAAPWAAEVDLTWWFEPGTYRFRAVATDRRYATGFSPPVTITLLPPE